MYASLHPEGRTRDFNDVEKAPARFEWVTYADTEGVIHKAMIYADVGGVNLEPVDQYLVVKNMSTINVTLTFNTALNAVVNPGTDMDVTILPGQMKAYPDLDPAFTPYITSTAPAECEVILIGFPEWPDYEQDWFCDMWAVGHDQALLQPLTVHFDGSINVWAQVANTLADDAILNDVAGITPGGGAVGYWAVGSNSVVNDGMFATYSTGVPNWGEVAAVGDETQYGNWGFAVNDFWSVGGGNTERQIWHWNGAAWSLSHFASVEVEPFFAVHGYTPNDVWAVGYSGVTRRWDGVTWNDIVPVPDPLKHLYGVWAWNADDVWVCGGTNFWGTPGGIGGIWRRQAGVWVLQTIPASETLRAIWGFSPTDIWCVGDSNMILHWDGANWTQIASPLASTFNYEGVFGCYPWEVMACGYEVGSFARIAGWDGVSWTNRWTSTTETDRLYGIKGVALNP
jgi:hypothetical protein